MKYVLKMIVNKLSLGRTLSTISNKVTDLKRKLKRVYFYGMFEKLLRHQKLVATLRKSLTEVKKKYEIKIINDSIGNLISEKTLMPDLLNHLL